VLLLDVGHGVVERVVCLIPNGSSRLLLVMPEAGLVAAINTMVFVTVLGSGCGK